MIGNIGKIPSICKSQCRTASKRVDADIKRETDKRRKLIVVKNHFYQRRNLTGSNTYIMLKGFIGLILGPYKSGIDVATGMTIPYRKGAVYLLPRPDWLIVCIIIGI